MKNDKPMKAMEMVDMLIQDLNILKTDALKFDKGNDSAGLRLRKQIKKIISKMITFRKEIQRTRYYREAWDVYYGRKTYIDGLKTKEKKYGTIAQVVKIQNVQKWRA